MSEEQKEIHVIPKDAIVPIDIGAGFIARLQKILLYLIEDKSEEEVDQFKVLASNDSAIPEDSWMFHFKTIQSLVLALEQSAIAKNITVLKNIDEFSQG